MNVKLILDGEEEFGSPTLAGVLAEHADKLDADVLLFCDGPMHQSRRRQLVFGVRGSTTVELTTYGPNRPLHSGHYGGWAPNPNESLVRLLAGLHDAEGNVLIPGFADAARPPTTQERAAIAAMPEMDDALQAEFGLGRRLGGEMRLEERILGPAIIVKGIDGGGVGDAAANVIRSRARGLAQRTHRARADAGDRARELPRLARRARVPRGPVARTHGGGTARSPAGRAPRRRPWLPRLSHALTSPEAGRLLEVLDAIGGEPTLLTPTMGGSLPVYRFDAALDMPILFLPVANHDNNQHGRDENLRIRNLLDAIDMFAALLAAF